jgi:hypothetical protein
LGAGWDEDLLRIELAILHQEDYPLDLVGFDDIELSGHGRRRTWLMG